ncbi:MAG: hypothetical protein AMXMBFR23_11110 [Chloroflexota bacterium]
MRDAVLERRPSAPFRAGLGEAHDTVWTDHTPDRAAARHYEALLALRADELRDRAARELAAEARLSDLDRRQAAHRRLTAWLTLDAEDARILARAYDEAAASLDREAARARFEAERDAILHGLRFEEFTRLVEFVPWLRSHLGLSLMGQAARDASDGSPLAA